MSGSPEKATQHDVLRLVTIPFSHYCEKARWALDRAGLGYREEPYLPLLSWLPALRAGRRRTVPVLVTRDGAVPDSTDILRWADAHGTAPALFPVGSDEVATVEEELDRRLGPAVRRVAYDAVLPDRRCLEALIDTAPRWQATLARPTRPALVAILKRGLGVVPAKVARSRERIAEIFAQTATRLVDGRGYLVGDRFTAADLTFAALAAPLVAPPGYRRWLPPEDIWPAAFREQVESMRATPVGQFVLRMYRDHRGLAS